MAGVGTSSISFSGLRTSWGNASYAGGSDPAASNSAVHPGIAISEFHGATFTSGNPIDANGAGDSVSIDTHFKGRTFGSSATTYYLQLNNDDALTTIRYTIDPSTYSSWTSGAGGAPPNNTKIDAFDNSGELVYTDSNTVISVSIQRLDDALGWVNATSITGFDTSGGSGLTVPSTPTGNNTFTITWSATGSSGSPQILGLSTD